MAYQESASHGRRVLQGRGRTRRRSPQLKSAVACRVTIAFVRMAPRSASSLGRPWNTPGSSRSKGCVDAALGIGRLGGRRINRFGVIARGLSQEAVCRELARVLSILCGGPGEPGGRRLR